MRVHVEYDVVRCSLFAAMIKSHFKLVSALAAKQQTVFVNEFVGYFTIIIQTQTYILAENWKLLFGVSTHVYFSSEW